jgi:RNA polymerase sigma-70 factor (ECF subfamily)
MSPRNELLLSPDQVELLESYIQKYQGILTSVACRIVHDKETAEDVVQNVFVRLCANLDVLDSAQVSSWLFKVCTNGAIQVLRKRKSGEKAFDELAYRFDEFGEDPLKNIENKEALKKVWDAVTHLPEKQQIVFTMRYYEDCSLATIATRLELALGSVKSHLHRAMQTLKTKLNDV